MPLCTLLGRTRYQILLLLTDLTITWTQLYSWTCNQQLSNSEVETHCFGPQVSNQLLQRRDCRYCVSEESPSNPSSRRLCVNSHLVLEPGPWGTYLGGRVESTSDRTKFRIGQLRQRQFERISCILCSCSWMFAAPVCQHCCLYKLNRTHLQKNDLTLSLWCTL